MENQKNLSGAQRRGVPAGYDTTYRRKGPGAKSLGVCIVHFTLEKYGQRGISLSPKMGRGVAAPRGKQSIIYAHKGSINARRSNYIIQQIYLYD